MKQEKLNCIAYQKGLVYEGNPDPILEVLKRAKAGNEITLAFLGGSITQGSLSSTPQGCYAYLTYDWWVKTFPQSRFTYVNAGIGGTTSHLGVGRVDEEVLRANPDLVIVEFSVNDPDDDVFYQETYEGLIRHILQAECNPAVLLVHNVRYDDGENAEQIHRPVGAHYQLPSVSMKPTIYEKIADGTLQNREITPDDLHPNDLGHAMVSKVITTYYEGLLTTVDEEKVYQKVNQKLPMPLTQNAYENAVRYRNDALEVIENEGFLPDQTPQSCVADCFKKGYMASKTGAHISFRVQGDCIAVQYRKTVRKPAPIASLIIDDDEKNAVLLDANFEETWGDCLYLEPAYHHGVPGVHKVEIKIMQTTEEDKECFYLVSLITTGGKA